MNNMQRRTGHKHGKQTENKGTDRRGLCQRLGRLTATAFPAEHYQKLTDIGIAGFFSQRHIGMNGVFILAADFGLGNIAGFFEVEDYLVGSPFGNADHIAYFARSAARMLGNRGQHQPMRRYKRPL